MHLTCQLFITSLHISIHYVGVPLEAVWGWPTSRCRTTNPLGSASTGGVKVISGATVDSCSAPIQWLYRGTQGPWNGINCVRGPKQRLFGTYGGMFPKDNPSGTESPSFDEACTTFSFPYILPLYLLCIWLLICLIWSWPHFQQTLLQIRYQLSCID